MLEDILVVLFDLEKVFFYFKLLEEELLVVSKQLRVSQVFDRICLVLNNIQFNFVINLFDMQFKLFYIKYLG